VLKSGCGYVALDAALPMERLRYMVEDSQVSLIITQQHLLDKLPKQSARVICLDTDWTKIAAESKENVNIISNPDDVAYVIYTSGSTGKPKGVAITHQAMANHCAAISRRYELQAGDRVLQFCSIGFDVAVEEIFPSLMSGAAVVIRPDDVISGSDLLHLIAQTRVSVLNLPSAYWNEWVHELSQLNEILPSTLRLMVIGSEKSSSSALSIWSKLCSEQVKFIHAYGTTETAVTSLIYQPENVQQIEPAKNSLPIGRPITNTQVYVLDGYLQPVPSGVAGELCIGGKGLAQGYLNRTDLTAEKFIPNPYSLESDARLYRTGDLARFLLDGNIEFLGRIDEQVKVRGYRIEPGEIEAALCEHEKVNEAVVAIYEDQSGGKRLVAYVVPRQQETTTAFELRSFLQSRLPKYMVPTAFVMLEVLPLTPNGKLDRRALPAPSSERFDQNNDFVAARTPLEKELAAIWTEILGIDEIGIHDNFFELGGHSLLATRVVSRLRQVFHKHIPLRFIFEYPTIAELANPLANHCAEDAQIPVLQSVTRTADLPLSFAQQRLWFINRLEPHSSAYNIATAIRLRGALDINAMKYALTEIVRRHEALRTRFSDIEGTPVQIIETDPHIDFPVEDLKGIERKDAQEELIKRLLQEEAQTAFDLGNGGLLRTRLLAIAEQEHILAITMHHIVSDGWSIEIFIREFISLYEAYKDGQSSALPALPIQYVDFALWQRNWLKGETLERQLAFWKTQLEGVQPLDLPTDRPRPIMQTYAGSQVPLVFDETLTAKLRELSKLEGVTVFMTLLAAFQLLLSRHSGQNDIAVGTPIAGRTQAELEPLIGMFVNTLVMRSKIENHLNFSELIQQVRETALNAYAHQDVPFEKLIEVLQPVRDPGRNPLVQTMFIFNQPKEVLRLRELTIEPLTQDTGTAKLDITLTVTEDETQMVGNIEFNTDLFDRDTIERMCSQFKVLIEAIVDSPDTRVSALPLMNGAERQQILHDWNYTEAAYQEGQSIQSLFESQAIRTPDAVAVSDSEEEITYGELNRRANQLARYLIELGVQPESPVAICLPRSIDLVVALLGVVKSGGCYVPMDAFLPVERLKFMLADSRATIVLTHDNLQQAQPYEGIQVVCMDTEQAFISTQCDDNLSVQTTDDSLMYVIYTSGSTGRPKAVLGTHRGAINRFQWMWKQFPFKKTDVCCIKTSLSFVDSIWECFGPLLAGVPSVVIPDHVVADAEAFIALLAQKRVTRIVVVPSLLDTWVSSGANLQALLPELTLWISSGEALSVRLAEKFASTKPGSSLVNLYGCSEVAADVTWHLCNEFENAGTIPIGRPLDNTQIYILDADLNPTAIGISGEIYVGGYALARGYRAYADATAERFVPNPFSQQAGERLYKTGDLGRYLVNGEVEYFGRADHQIKLRGYRIETAEIEHALASHPGVRQVLVTVSGRSYRIRRYFQTRIAQSGGTTSAFLHGSIGLRHR
jgi:amino acid adenylation domain-containing protein